MQVHEGQLTQVNFKYEIDGSTWCYGVIVAVFGGKFLVRREHGGLTMVHMDNSDVPMTNADGTFHVTPLSHPDGNPVLLKRSWRGKYKFPKY